MKTFGYVEDKALLDFVLKENYKDLTELEKNTNQSFLRREKSFKHRSFCSSKKLEKEGIV